VGPGACLHTIFGNYVAHLRRRGLGDRLVIYADGFDTAWLGCQRDLRKVLEAMDAPVFFGVEFGLFPACIVKLELSP